MKLKNLKRVSALALSLTLALTAVPAISTQAASKPTIVKSAATVISGVKTLKISKGGYKITSVKVKSSKTSVVKVKSTKSAVKVYGINSGSAKVTAIVVGTKAGKSKTFNLSTTVKVAAPTGYLEAETLSEGGTTNAYVSNIPAKATVEYISSAPSVAFVGEDGLVRAVSGGNTTIQAEITFPKTAMAKKTKKTITLGNLKVNEDAVTVMGNAQSLINALSYTYSWTAFPNGKDITLSTSSPDPITIPASASNFNVNLTIDAPNATITNLAGFRHLTINSVSMYTWKEKYAGTNTITLANSSVINVEVERGSYPEIYAWSFAKPTIKVKNGGDVLVHTKSSSSAPTLVMEDGGWATVEGDGSVDVDLTKTTDGSADVTLKNKGTTTITSSDANKTRTDSIIDNRTGKAITETIVKDDGTKTTNTIADESSSATTLSKPTISKEGNVYTASLENAPAGVTYTWKYADNNGVTGYDSSDLHAITSEASISTNVLTLTGTSLDSKYLYVIVSATGYTPRISDATAAVAYAAAETDADKAAYDAEHISLTINPTSKIITGAVTTGAKGSSIAWSVEDEMNASNVLGASHSVIGAFSSNEFAVKVGAGTGLIKAVVTKGTESVTKYWLVTADAEAYTSIDVLEGTNLTNRQAAFDGIEAATITGVQVGAEDVAVTGTVGVTYAALLSSDTEKATIAEGKVHAVAAGSADITVQASVDTFSVKKTISVSVAAAD